MITLDDPFIPAASVNQAYSQYITASGGIAPYSWALTTGALPTGLQMNNTGLIFGTATTLGIYTFGGVVSDSSSPPQTLNFTYQLQVLDLIQLVDSTVDQAQFVAQFEQELQNAGTWSAGLTTQTSQTLIEYISAIGTFSTSRVSRALEDSFPETAQSDSSIRAIANMQGLRLNRKLPSTVSVTIESTQSETLSPFTQFSAGGYTWFNAEPIVLIANIPKTVTLKEGTVKTQTFNGLGSDFQVWVSDEDNFTVSDQDVVVQVNNVDAYKSFGALWNYPGLLAVADNTLSTGRMMIQFGSQGYGSVPGVNDTVTVIYAVTNGSTVNGANLFGARLTCTTDNSVSGTIETNPSGGADEKSPVAYKNFAAGSFGSYSSGVTKAQYASLVNNYPGIIDAFTQAQREVNPASLQWMNVIRVSALTNSTWSQSQVNDFINYAQGVTMYSPRFLWQAPVPITVDVQMNVYCFNSVNSTAAVNSLVTKAIQNLFAPRKGILMTDFFESDLTEAAMNAAPGQISYVEVITPTQAMIVTAPLSPQIIYLITNSGGSLQPSVYSYAISVDAPSPSQYLMGVLDGSTHPAFPSATVAGQYWISSGVGTIGSLAVAVGDQLLATGPGNAVGNFQVIAAADNTVVDIGVPTNWVYPQVTVSNSHVLLDWSSNPVKNAIAYHVWGRRAGHLGIIATLPASQYNYIDNGGADPTPLQIGVTSDTLIRYNTLGNLSINTTYAKRQSSLQFPIRDSNL